MLLPIKLTFFILLVSLMQVSAAGFGQSFTLHNKSISIENVFREIRKQTKYDVLIEDTELNLTQKISVDFQHASIEDVIKTVIRDKDLSFTVKDQIIVISKKEQSILDVIKETIKPVIQFNTNLRGLVTDNMGQPLHGATIVLKGEKTYHLLTDNYGRFNFTAVPEGPYQLSISYIGYEKQDRNIVVKGDIPLQTFVLNMAVSVLDQVQVIAYGANTRRNSVGAVTTVTAETIENQPVQNVVQALQGQVPGLVVTNLGGVPGAAVRLQVRGQNTLAQIAGATKPYNEPLFIVDGVPFALQGGGSLGNLLTNNPGASSAGARNGMSPFALLNPADIESISVLRDADATSIYGSQGANGVILITTKKGKPGKPSFTLSVNSSADVPTKALEMMSTEQYLSMRREAMRNDNVVVNPITRLISYPDVEVFDQTRYTNWYKEFFNKIPLSTDVYASFSGGQQNTTFIVSGGYSRMTYNFPGDFANNRYTLHSGLNYKSPNNKLNIQFISDFSYAGNNASAQPRVVAAMVMAPKFPALVDERNNLLWDYKGVAFSDLQNQQFARLRQPASLKSYNFTNSVRIAYQIVKHLTISTNVGYNRINSSNYSAIPAATLAPSTIANSRSAVTATFGTNTNQVLNVEPQLEYKSNLGPGELTVLVGGSYRNQSNYTETITGSGYTNDALLGSVIAPTLSTSNTRIPYKYAAGFARVGYIYARKYIVNLTGRRDASSLFGPGQQFGTFGSAGLGWIFSEESFITKAAPFLSFGKLSANFGTNGNDAVSAYQYQNYYALVPANNASAFQNITGYLPSNLYNPNYSWSTKKSWNAALDLGFLNDRFLLNLTWYQNRTSDQLVSYSLPDQTGFASVVDNFPATVQNRGLEFSINSNNIQTQNFKWTSNFNISGNRNKLVAFPGIESSPYATAYTVGQSVNTFNGYRYSGVNPTTGVFEFYAANGTLTSSPNTNHISRGGDLQPLFNLDPQFTGGLGNTLSYKGVSLNVFFQFVKQMGRNYLGNIYAYSTPGNYNFNLPAVVAGQYWQQAGDNKPMQRVTVGQNIPAVLAVSPFVASTGAYSDASYVRLKTVALSWNLPNKWIKSIGARGVRLNLAAQNLLTFTGYKIGDPELNGSLFNIPLQRTISADLSVNF